MLKQKNAKKVLMNKIHVLTTTFMKHEVQFSKGTILNEYLLTTGQSTWVNQKEENLSFTGAYSAVFILFNTFAIKTEPKKRRASMEFHSRLL